MLIENLFRAIKMDNFESKEPHQIKSWTDLLAQLIRVVATYEDLDPSRVMSFTE